MTPLEKKTLFWDTDISKLDVKKHSRFIIERILRFGNISDYNWMREQYNEDQIKEVLLRDRVDLDPRSINFWYRYFNIDEALCTKKLLAKTQELYWKNS